VHQLFIDFRKADSVKREVLYNILLEVCVPKMLLRLIKRYLMETYGKFRVGKLLSEISYSEWPETGRCCIVIALQFALEYAIRKIQKHQVVWN
jgi:hypothetical protein